MRYRRFSRREGRRFFHLTAYRKAVILHIGQLVTQVGGQSHATKAAELDSSDFLDSQVYPADRLTPQIDASRYLND